MEKVIGVDFFSVISKGWSKQDWGSYFAGKNYQIPFPVEDLEFTPTKDVVTNIVIVKMEIVAQGGVNGEKYCWAFLRVARIFDKIGKMSFANKQVSKLNIEHGFLLRQILSDKKINNMGYDTIIIVSDTFELPHQADQCLCGAECCLPDNPQLLAITTSTTYGFNRPPYPYKIDTYKADLDREFPLMEGESKKGRRFACAFRIDGI